MLLADDFARVLHQNHQDIEGTAAQVNRDARLLEKSFCRDKAEWAE
jgi:hypothetical protein